MKNHMTSEDTDGPGDVPSGKDASSAGIGVYEPIDIESIELSSRNSRVIADLGWEMVPTMHVPPSPILAGSTRFLVDAEEDRFDGGDEIAAQQLEALKQEQLRLAADLADLRRVAASRERDLVAIREQIAQRETELSKQFARIASLTLDCGGLRSQLRSLDATPPETAGSSTNSGRSDQEMIDLLKEHLAERYSVIAVAKGEAEQLRSECERLRDILARQLAQDSNGRGQDGPPWQRSLLRLLPGIRKKAEAKHLAAFAGEPGAEVPTIALDQAPGPERTARETVVQARMLAEARRERRRQAAVEAAADTLKPRQLLSSPALHRYLIGLSPQRGEVRELLAPRTYVGRGFEADVRLADATVSRLHGVLSLENGDTVIEDLASRNGIFINGRRTKRAALRDGDTIDFGTFRYKYRVGPSSHSGH